MSSNNKDPNVIETVSFLLADDKPPNISKIVVDEKININGTIFDNPSKGLNHTNYSKYIDGLIKRKNDKAPFLAISMGLPGSKKNVMMIGSKEYGSGLVKMFYQTLLKQQFIIPAAITASLMIIPPNKSGVEINNSCIAILKKITVRKDMESFIKECRNRIPTESLITDLDKDEICKESIYFIQLSYYNRQFERFNAGFLILPNSGAVTVSANEERNDFNKEFRDLIKKLNGIGNITFPLPKPILNIASIMNTYKDGIFINIYSLSYNKEFLDTAPSKNIEVLRKFYKTFADLKKIKKSILTKLGSSLFEIKTPAAEIESALLQMKEKELHITEENSKNKDECYLTPAPLADRSKLLKSNSNPSNNIQEDGTEIDIYRFDDTHSKNKTIISKKPISFEHLTAGYQVKPSRSLNKPNVIPTFNTNVAKNIHNKKIPQSDIINSLTMITPTAPPINNDTDQFLKSLLTRRNPTAAQKIPNHEQIHDGIFSGRSSAISEEDIDEIVINHNNNISIKNNNVFNRSRLPSPLEKERERDFDSIISSDDDEFDNVEFHISNKVSLSLSPNPPNPPNSLNIYDTSENNKSKNSSSEFITANNTLIETNFDISKDNSESKDSSKDSSINNGNNSLNIKTREDQYKEYYTEIKKCEKAIKKHKIFLEETKSKYYIQESIIKRGTEMLNGLRDQMNIENQKILELENNMAVLKEKLENIAKPPNNNGNKDNKKINTYVHVNNKIAYNVLGDDDASDLVIHIEEAFPSLENTSTPISDRRPLSIHMLPTDDHEIKLIPIKRNNKSSRVVNENDVDWFKRAMRRKEMIM